MSHLNEKEIRVWGGGGYSDLIYYKSPQFSRGCCKGTEGTGGETGP